MRRHRNHQQLLPHHGHRHEIRFLDGQREQARVNAPGADLLHGTGRRRGGEAEIELRVDALEVFQQRREDVEADGHAAGEAQRTAQGARAVGNGANGLAHVLEHPLPELDERLRRRRHPYLPADPQEQRLAELLFEQENLAADCRLRDVELSTARGERSGFGDCLQDFELAQVHAGRL
jgi:hypothetical protein